MNLWIFNHYAITPDMPGGTRHYDLASELVHRGHKVTIFASSFHHGRYQEMKLAPNESWKVEDVDGIKFIWVKTFPYQRNNWRRVLNMVSYMLRAWSIGRRLPKLASEIERPDVVIGSSVHLGRPQQHVERVRLTVSSQVHHSKPAVRRAPQFLHLKLGKVDPVRNPYDLIA